MPRGTNEELLVEASVLLHEIKWTNSKQFHLLVIKKLIMDY
jgi:hypothetical protein